SFGLVALEAQACGTPVLAADVGGLSAVVQDGVTGVLVPGHEPERWADALDRLLADEAGLAEMGRAAERRALGFDWAASAAQVLEVYRGVMTG
ncbi:glycosyltransferase, partial [Georgenia sp. 10Sc9-8]|nr:glycosyltransferase [Georgenia halotolerans]